MWQLALCYCRTLPSNQTIINNIAALTKPTYRCCALLQLYTQQRTYQSSQVQLVSFMLSRSSLECGDKVHDFQYENGCQG